jgi:hypothetical protein
LIGSKVSFKFKSSTLLKVDAALADGNLAIPGYVALSEVAVVVAGADFQADLVFLTCKANDEPVILPAAGILVAIDAVSSAHAVLAVRFEKRCRRTNRLVERGQDPAPPSVSASPCGSNLWVRFHELRAGGRTDSCSRGDCGRRLF